MLGLRTPVLPPKKQVTPLSPKHRRLTKRISYSAQSSHLLFFPQKEAASFINAINKKYIIKSELNI